MITQEMIDRINELARKKKEKGLTEEEAEETAELEENAETEKAAEPKEGVEAIEAAEPEEK